MILISALVALAVSWSILGFLTKKSETELKVVENRLIARIGQLEMQYQKLKQDIAGLKRASSPMPEPAQLKASEHPVTLEKEGDGPAQEPVSELAASSGDRSTDEASGNDPESTTEQGVTKQSDVPSNPLVGQWTCSFTSGDYTYPPMPCSIRKKNGKLYLEKHRGSQRIRGYVSPKGEGITFNGTYFCPLGDCTGPAKGTFTKRSETRWKGTLQHSDPRGTKFETIVTLERQK